MVSALASINEVNQRRARLLLRWVTVSGFNSRRRTFISVCDQPPRSTQPGHPFVGRHNEYQPKGGDALWLGSKGRYVFVCGWQKTVLCPCYTWAISERSRDKELIHKALYKFAFFTFFTFTFTTSSAHGTRQEFASIYSIVLRGSHIVHESTVDESLCLRLRHRGSIVW